MSIKKELVMMKIGKIKEYERNNKKHWKAQVEKIKKSILENEYINPVIIDEKGVILAGHWRIRAIRLLKWEEVQVLQIKWLDEKQKKKYRLLDNRLADYSTYDLENLEEELKDLMDDDIIDEFASMDIFKDVEEDWLKAEIEFSEELYESHNYVILYFDNDVDWMTAKEKLGIKTVKAKDAKPGYVRSGIGRVIDWGKFLERLMD